MFAEQSITRTCLEREDVLTQTETILEIPITSVT